LILYLDTSALIKLYAEEPETEEVRDAIGEAQVITTSEIGYVEARSALARKERDGSFSTQEHDDAVEQLDRDFEEVYLLRLVSGGIIARAGDLTRQHSLRAYDAATESGESNLPETGGIGGVSPVLLAFYLMMLAGLSVPAAVHATRRLRGTRG
jgi:predicted nucleic acid-binding protein